MKLLRLSLLLMIPVLGLARPEVSVFPLSPYFEPGETNTVLVSIKNNGTNSIPIPPGLKLDNGFVMPSKDPINRFSFTELTNGTPNIFLEFSEGSTGPVDISIDLVEQALEHSPKAEVWDQLHGKHFLKPHETITYKQTWVYDPQHSSLRTRERLKTHNPAMICLFLRFYGYDIKVPSISLYQKPKSNQKLPPAPLNASDEVKASTIGTDQSKEEMRKKSLEAKAKGEVDLFGKPITN